MPNDPRLKGLSEYTKQWIMDNLNRERDILDAVSKSVRGVANLVGDESLAGFM